jgi:hypothetical protein
MGSDLLATGRDLRTRAAAGLNPASINAEFDQLSSDAMSKYRYLDGPDGYRRQCGQMATLRRTTN